MHRVELKAEGFCDKHGIRRVFLMHRVELKDAILCILWKSLKEVPNAPCGVESADRVRESNNHLSFLMHRVELKGGSPFVQGHRHHFVPNAPCGVESDEGLIQKAYKQSS